MKEFRTFEIEKAKIEATNIVKLVRITVDDNLNFDERISELLKTSSMQLNAISSFQKFTGKSKKEATKSSFIFTNFNYCLLV